MKCGFCGREVDKGTIECPYCHYRFQVDAQVLTPKERDSFDGVTIDEDMGTNENTSSVYNEEYNNNAYNKNQTVPPNLRVHTFGCGSGILMTFLILCGILAVFFFLLPTFIVFAAIGAVVVFILRLFL